MFQRLSESWSFARMHDTNKTYFSISEVCAMMGLEPHVLRYWETEFSQLRPKKNRAGNRAYRVKDIGMIRYIRHLLYEEQYTIIGAKKKLTAMKDDVQQMQLDLAVSSPAEQLKQVKKELQHILSGIRP
jgi:DNA-binding transcriptional MerR regulator